jgi:hypothetical protein
VVSSSDFNLVSVAGQSDEIPRGSPVPGMCWINLKQATTAFYIFSNLSFKIVLSRDAVYSFQLKKLRKPDIRKFSTLMDNSKRLISKPCYILRRSDNTKLQVTFKDITQSQLS